MFKSSYIYKDPRMTRFQIVMEFLRFQREYFPFILIFPFLYILKMIWEEQKYYNP